MTCRVNSLKLIIIKSSGDAASIFGLCVSPDECKNRLGEFSHYCPVSLATKHELVDCSYETTMKYTAEYRARYYKMAGQKELEMFLAEAHKYVSPSAPHILPDSLPRYVTKAEVKQLFPKELAFRGYCPVTYVLGNKRSVSILFYWLFCITFYLSKLEAPTLDFAITVKHLKTYKSYVQEMATNCS